MKALTLWQPWASLIACERKTIETRAWSTKYRGPLAIHAAANVPPQAYLLLDSRQGAELRRLCAEALPTWKLHQRNLGLPLGVVVATCTLVDVVPTESSWWCDAAQWADDDEDAAHMKAVGWGADGDGYWTETGQRPYGDFTPGRFAWLLADVVALPEPAPARGRQQLWSWEP